MKNMVVLRRVRGVKARGTRFLSNRTGANPFEATYLNKREANYMPLSPVSFLLRNMEAYPDYIASIHGNNTSYKLTWQQMGERASQLASSLTKTFKLKKFDVVSIISANSPAMYEAHFALPGAGIILHTINTRLDATTIAYQLKHCQAKVVLMDTEYTMLMAQVRQLLSKDTSTDMPQFVYIQDPGYPDQGELDSWQGSCISYDDLLEGGDKHHPLVLPSDELDPITLNYTSGTTGNPKGVVAHHRGAYLNAISNVLEGHIEKFASYLWVVPMFHCNGWCFTWSMAAVTGTNILLRQVRAPLIFELIDKYKVGYFGGAPIIMNTLLDCPQRVKFSHPVKMWTAGAPPPELTIHKLRSELNVHAQTAYGLTETYGPISTYACYDPPKQSEGMKGGGTSSGEPYTEMNRLMVQHKDTMMDIIKVLDPTTLHPIPSDGKTLGEVMVKGNIVMKGYLDNEKTTEETFKGGWFRTGDIAVCYGKGRFEIKDRSKDIIISGGENISSIEVENIMLTHPYIKEVAVVAMPNEKWGEVPAAFVALSTAAYITEAALISWCRDKMAHYYAPKKVIFMEDGLPKTSTGKVQKHELRKLLKDTVN